MYGRIYRDYVMLGNVLVLILLVVGARDISDIECSALERTKLQAAEYKARNRALDASYNVAERSTIRNRYPQDYAQALKHADEAYVAWQRVNQQYRQCTQR